MQFIKTKALAEGLRKLHSRGGKFQKAADLVFKVIGRISSGEERPFAGVVPTNHGETRLEHCLKYDLTGFCRLITVQHEKACFLLYVGDHDDCDKWLDKNRGKKFAVNEAGEVLEVVAPVETVAEGERLEFPERKTAFPMLEQLSVGHQDYLFTGISYSLVKRLNELTTIDSDAHILDVCSEIQDKKKQELLLNVYIALISQDIEMVDRLIAADKGILQPVDSVDELVGTKDLQVIPLDSPQYAALFEHFVKTADYREWMLFMHPEQERVASEDYAGPAKLIGVSGSGKTCVVVRRAVNLAQKYPGEKVLIITLNRSLAALIADLIDAASPVEIKDWIEVKPFFQVCQEMLKRFEPDNERLYDDVTWKSKEHIDEIWREYYRCELNNYDARVMESVHDSLISIKINAEIYIKDEFDWVRSTVQPDRREDYLGIERRGRSFPLSRSYRERLLEGLSGWESKMRLVGVTDHLGIATALHRHFAKIEPEYRCILIDECQDFGTVEMSIVRKLVANDQNDIFLCGDAAQRVTAKSQSLRAAGIDIPGARSRKITQNYRNSREVLSAAYNVLVNNLTDELLITEDFEVLDPQYASRSGPMPLLLRADSVAGEIGGALQYIREELERNPNWKACIALCGYSAFEVKSYADLLGLSVLDGSTNLGESSIYVSDLEQTKGFEFDVVVVACCSNGVLPNTNMPEVEQANDLARLYVAMTRAKSQLIVSYSNEPSRLFGGAMGFFLTGEWSDYLEEAPKEMDIPKRLHEMSSQQATQRGVVWMSGEQFLYTENAIGLSQLLIEKIRLNITGKSVRRNGSLVKWKNVGSAFDSISVDVKSRQAFGPEGFRQFKSLGEELGLPLILRQLSKQDLYFGAEEESA